jgi:hypothetical protein
MRLLVEDAGKAGVEAAIVKLTPLCMKEGAQNLFSSVPSGRRTAIR